MADKERKAAGPLGAGTVGAAGTEFVAKKAVLTVNGVTMAAAKNWTFDWGLGVHEEPVCATDIPRVIHGVFHGECECEAVYVSDDNWLALASNRDIVYTISSVDTDTQGSPASKTILCTVKINRVRRVGPPNADGVVRCSVRAIMTAFPTVS